MKDRLAKVYYPKGLRIKAVRSKKGGDKGMIEDISSKHLSGQSIKTAMYSFIEF